MFNKHYFKVDNPHQQHNLWLCYFVDEIIEKIENRDYAKVLSKKAIANSAIMLFNQVCFIAEDCLDKELIKEISINNPLASLSLDLATDEEKTNTSNKLYEKMVSAGKSYFDKEAPQLRPEIEHRCELFLNAYDKMIERILKNSKTIAKEFFDKDDFDLIEDIESGTPDLHNNGSYTTLVTSNIGKFIYKPHSVINDKWFSNLANRYFSDVIHVPEIISINNEYGFSKFINNKPASSLEDVSKYYYNMGGLSAILYMFGANDYHKENLLADGVNPVIVDFETILKTEKRKSESAGNNPFNEYNESVCYTGLLPYRVPKKDMEISALLDTSKDNPSMPEVDGKKISIIGYVFDFLAGFEDTYLKLLNIKDEIINEINSAKNLTIRILPISTHFYIHILKYSYNKERLQSIETRKKETERFYLVCEKNKELYPFAKSEEDQVLNGDIPYYYINADEKSIYSSGELILNEYVTDSPKQLTINRINKMNHKDMEIQLSLLKEHLGLIIVNDEEDYYYRGISKEESDTDTLKTEMINIFNEIKNRTIKFENDNISWINFSKTGNSSICGFDLFDGLAGNALFFAEFNKLIDDETLKTQSQSLYEKCLDEISYYIDFYKGNDNIQIGLGGIGGVIISLTQIDTLNDSPKAKELLNKLADVLINKNFETITTCDVYSGISGLIYALYKYYEHSNNKEVVDIIDKLANRLISLRTLKYNDYYLWDTLDLGRPISGWGHGIIGIVEALTLAFRLTNKKEYIDNATSAFRYEHEIYSDKLKTWPDLRDLSFADAYMHGLCSGAPGVGLALLEIKKEKEYFENYDINYSRAIEACKTKPLNYRDNLCCGSCAVIHFLINDYKVNNNISSLKESSIIMNNVINRKNINTTYVFVKQGSRSVNNISLFFGISGIGYEMARLLQELKNK